MIEDCSCHGKNPNCFKCDGKGYYDKDKMSDSPIIVNIPNVSKPNRNISTPSILKTFNVKCPFCKLLFPKCDIFSHIRSCKNRPEKKSFYKKEKKEQSIYCQDSKPKLIKKKINKVIKRNIDWEKIVIT
jgi:hypothetical protein